MLLGCVQPGEAAPTFGYSLRRLTDAATFLYVDGKRYWYSTQPSVTRLAQDRAEQYDSCEVWSEIEKRLRGEGEGRLCRGSRGARVDDRRPRRDGDAPWRGEEVPPTA